MELGRSANRERQLSNLKVVAEVEHVGPFDLKIFRFTGPFCGGTGLSLLLKEKDTMI